MRMLITGGGGDLSQIFCKLLSPLGDIDCPTRAEMDVTDVDSVENYIGDTRYDIVINNAGVLHSAVLKDSDPLRWINDINVNLIGTYLVTRKVADNNISVKIINISSTAAFNAYKDWSSYCCSKAGVVTFTKCLASDGYNAYCLCPGAIDTKFRKQFNITNPNIMDAQTVGNVLLDVVNGKYKAGDILFFRKNEFIINPAF